jgi:hypothetical protein
MARRDPGGASGEYEGDVFLALEQSAGEYGPFEELGVGSGHLWVGEGGEDLDAVGLCSPDQLYPPLDGPGVYGKQAVDGEEPRLLG